MSAAGASPFLCTPASAGALARDRAQVCDSVESLRASRVLACGAARGLMPSVQPSGSLLSHAERACYHTPRVPAITRLECLTSSIQSRGSLAGTLGVLCRPSSREARCPASPPAETPTTKGHAVACPPARSAMALQACDSRHSRRDKARCGLWTRHMPGSLIMPLAPGPRGRDMVGTAGGAASAAAAAAAAWARSASVMSEGSRASSLTAMLTPSSSAAAIT